MEELKAVLHGRLLDGTGADTVKDSAVIIRGSRIEKVGNALETDIPREAAVIDAAGKTVMPGIIEGHAHVGGDFRAQKTLRLTLQRGITTVCSVSANPPGIKLREAIETGDARGCSRLVAGCIVTCTNGHVKFRAADGPWEVRKAVREMVEATADFIKTAASGGFYGRHESTSSPNYTLEELTALTEEAHAWGIPVVAHCHTQPGLDNCVKAGVDQIHHGAFIDEPAVRGILEKGLFYMPTLAVTCRRNIEGYSDQPWQTKEMEESREIHRKGVSLAHSLGVNLALGTDYPGNPRAWDVGDKTMFELEELVNCGLTPKEAIAAATGTNAKAYRISEDIGTISEGKKADLLIVDGNPEENIKLLYDMNNINLVMKDGAVESADESYSRFYRIRENNAREPSR